MGASDETRQPEGNGRNADCTLDLHKAPYSASPFDHDNLETTSLHTATVTRPGYELWIVSREGIMPSFERSSAWATEIHKSRCSCSPKNAVYELDAFWYRIEDGQDGRGEYVGP